MNQIKLQKSSFECRHVTTDWTELKREIIFYHKSWKTFHVFDISSFDSKNVCSAKFRQRCLSKVINNTDRLFYWRWKLIQYTGFHFEDKTSITNYFYSLHKKGSSPSRISSVNVTKSAVSFRFVHIYWRNP